MPAATMTATRRRRLSSNRSDSASIASTPHIPSVQEAEALFETMTVAEMQEKRKVYNTGIEAKRQELRMLVGKRYAGLIEVADGISDMASSVGGVTATVATLKQKCIDLKKRPRVEEPIIDESKAQFYSIAVQTKLLVSLPSRISLALQGGELSRAATLMLLGTHIHSGLRLDTAAPNASQLLPFFPVVSRIWPSIARFRQVIAASARKQLTNPALTAANAVDASVALVILEGMTLRQVFAEFLLARTESLNKALSQATTSSIKDQLTESLGILILSLKLVDNIFSDSEESLQNRLSSFSSSIISADIKAAVGLASRALPPNVADFCPALKGRTMFVTPEQLADKCQAWFEASSLSLRTSLSSQLIFISTVMGLAHLRDVVARVLIDQDVTSSWAPISERLLGRVVCVWRDCVRPLLLNRMEEIVQAGLKKVVHGLINCLKVSGSSSTDLLSYMWSESVSDIPKIDFGQGKTQGSSELRLKTLSRSRNLQELCQGVDASLKYFLGDVQHFVVPKENSSIDLTEDLNFTSSLISKTTHQAMQDLLSFIDEQLDSFAEDTNGISVNTILFCGRVCDSLMDEVPILFKALVPTATFTEDYNDQMSTTSLSTSMSSSLRRSALSLSTSKTSQALHQDSSLYTDIKDDLHKRHYRCWATWRQFAVNATLTNFKDEVLGGDNEHRENYMKRVLTASRLTAWETFDIQEDSDSSAIRVPSQASAGLHSVLHRLCCCLNRAAGFAVPTNFTAEMAEDLLKGIIGLFALEIDSLIASSNSSTVSGSSRPCLMNQAIATQILFDIKYLQQLLSHRGTAEATKTQVESILSRLETFIDPFDLDLVGPHLETRVNRHVAKTAGLYGLLAGGRGTKTSGVSAGSERASTLLLVPGHAVGGRFQTIPLPTSGSRDAKRRGMDAVDGSIPNLLTGSPRRKEEEKSGGDLRKVATWSQGLSKLTTRDGSSSPSDLFKSGAALYQSWFGGGE